MTNETIGRVVGVFLGAALIVAGLSAFGSGTLVAQHPEVRTSVAFRLAGDGANGAVNTVAMHTN